MSGGRFVVEGELYLSLEVGRGTSFLLVGPEQVRPAAEVSPSDLPPEDAASDGSPVDEGSPL